jgi:1-acyl-sn-glycerol-3-phosphate acyltransferase
MPCVSLPNVSPQVLRAFTWYARRYLARHFSEVLLGRPPALPDLRGRPVIVYANHPAWWDPLFGLVIARHSFPERAHFAAMDAAALHRFPLFKRLGFFGVARNSGTGAMQFLRTADAILSQDDSCLWLTPQGRFSDVRERPARLEPGLAHLATRWPRAVLLPLALEYTFWNERLPVALAHWGEPLDAAELEANRRWTTGLLASRLAATQDQLAARAAERTSAGFDVLIRGRAGLADVYGLWRSLLGRPVDLPETTRPLEHVDAGRSHP